LGRDWFGPSHGLQANHERAVHGLQTLGTTRVQMVRLPGSRLLANDERGHLQRCSEPKSGPI
jgi:hypothetical protein